jgi:predicted RNase H-like HicB family nuclease
MHNEYTAIIKKDGDWWIGWIEEISGVNAQEETKEELLI